MKVLIRPDWAGDSIIKRTRHTPERIIRKLNTAEQLIAQGKTDVCRALEVSQPDVTPFIGPGAMRVGGHAAAA